MYFLTLPDVTNSTVQLGRPLPGRTCRGVGVSVCPWTDVQAQPGKRGVLLLAGVSRRTSPNAQ